MTFFHHYGPIVGALAVMLVGFEWAWLAISKHRLPRDSTTNIVTFVIGEMLRLVTAVPRVTLFIVAAEWSPLKRPMTIVDALACYVLVDLILYLWHRVLHETAFGWAFHSVHHSSAEFELTLGGRVHWVQRIVDDIVYLPLALLGFSAPFVLMCMQVNRLAQFWPHTEAIGKLRWFDGWLNTPSNHRVHHENKPGGARSNYASNFMVWDRLFGTFEPEQRAVMYGTELGDVGRNPLRIQLAGVVAWARRLPEGALLRGVYSAWFIVWAPTYALVFGPSVLGWTCCVGQSLLLAGLWLKRPVLSSLSALLVLGPQLAWNIDVVLQLSGSALSFGAANTLFDSHALPIVRVMTLFHVWMPALLFVVLRRDGYSARALPWALATAPTLVVYGLLVGDGINRADLGFFTATLGFICVFIVPTHLVLTAVSMNGSMPLGWSMLLGRERAR